MRLTRSLRMLRWPPLAALVALAACEHGDANQLVSIGGDTLILNVSMTTSTAGGLPGGSSAVNRFLATAFDTSFADAFNRSSTNPASYFPDPALGACYGTTPLIVPSGQAKVLTYQSPNRYLPALAYQVTMEDACGGGQATNLIVPKGHPGNGAGNLVWEFWFDFSGATASTRYVMGVARYALQQRGALDIAEILLTGAVTEPDTLVFRTGDFNPGGKTSRDRFTTSCTSVNVIHPTAGANPHLLGSDTTRSGSVDLDQTVCATTGEAWSGLGTATSPVPANNNTGLGTNQYNFFVIWEALPDSTPNYAKPVFRAQIGPLPTTAGAIVNNSYGPLPPAALTAAQLALLTGATSRPDTVTVDMSNLAQLASGSAYQVWFVKGGTDSAAKATGNVYKIVGGVAVDSQLNASEFNADTTTGASWRIRIDYGQYASLAAFNTVVLTIASASGSTLPSSQPLWSGVSSKSAGQPAPALTATMSFGTFDAGGANKAVWGLTGRGEGGTAGRNLDITVSHVVRPPVGFFYNAYLRNTTTGAALDLGPITGLFPDYASLVDADINATGTVNAVEVVQAMFRYRASSETELCGYDRIELRMEPKLKASGIIGPLVALGGTIPYPDLERCE